MARRIWFSQTYNNGYRYVSDLRSSWSGEELLIIGTHLDPEAAVLQACDRVAPEPASATPEEYAEWAIGFARAHEVEVMVTRREPLALAARAEDFEAIGCKLTLPSHDPDVLRLLGDKQATYEAAGALGLPLPAWKAADDEASMRAAFTELTDAGHQLVLKPCVGVAAMGFMRLSAERRPLALEGLYGYRSETVGVEDVLAALSGQGRVEPLLLVEYLPGNEYSVDCLAHEGKLVAGVVRSKSGLHRRLVEREDLVAHSATLTEHFGLSGLFNVQFMDTGDGEAKLLEVNTRISGGMEQSAAAGVQLLPMALELALYGECSPLAPMRRATLRQVPGSVLMRPQVALEPWLDANGQRLDEHDAPAHAV